VRVGGLVLTLIAVLLPALVGTPHITMSTSTSVAAGATAKPGATVKLFVDVMPDAKIRVYAPGAKDYLPVALELSPPPAGVRAGKLTYPPSQDWYFEPLKEHVPVYQAPFRLTQDIMIAKDAKAGQSVTVQGVFKYQACSDTICYNPVNAPVSWTLSIR
jgi:cytochrome c biogenesis DsbD-like protein